jgi:allophanate hydrolase
MEAPRLSAEIVGQAQGRSVSPAKAFRELDLSETVAELVAAHRSGTMRPEETVARTFARIRKYNDPALFISLRQEADALAEARALGSQDLPLLGVPVSVKDNIDVAGLPTTAACPAFSYMPAADAVAVARLRRAGAIVIGKTNLDQFATGLVGIRSPYGVPRNPFNSDLTPGGSSSGSAVAVAAGLTPLALGTDTAGSGRVPAGFNNIVGLKPSLGLAATTGLLPACRSLDCVSIFALTTEDAFASLAAIAGPDRGDPFSRPLAVRALGNLPPVLRVAVPRAADLVFFGDTRAEHAFASARRLLADLGASIVEIDLTPFTETVALLYDGPWIAERVAAVGDFLARQPDDVHPVTRSIIERGRAVSAVDTFRGFYRLAELRARARETLAQVDVLMVPTVPAAYTVAQIEADPIGLNTKLGTYTNFVNLQDLAALAVPATIATDGTPFGVTFLAPAGQDAQLASLGRVFHARTGLSLGALGLPQPPLGTIAPSAQAGEIAVAVVGAHLSGMPLNGELRALGARFLEKTATAADYRLYALAGTVPPKPGLLRVAPGQGAAIEVETWAIPTEGFGRFVAAVPPPMTIGTLRLIDGRDVKGFLVEAQAVDGARDISRFGSWRGFMGSAAAPSR